MPATATQFRRSDSGRQDTDRRREYFIEGAATIDEAYAAILAIAPPRIGNLVRGKPHADPVRATGGIWFGSIEYSTNDFSPPQPDEQEFAIDMTGGTATVTQAREHKADYALPGFGTAPNHRGAINVKRTSSGELVVEGVELPIPSYEFERTVYVPNEKMVQAFIDRLADLKTGYNNAEWTVTTDDGVTLTYPAGEVTFLGARISKRGKTSPWPVVQKFRREPNLENATVGGFTGVNKLGADLIWFEYHTVKDPDSGSLVSRAIYAHVEGVGVGPVNFDELLPSDSSEG